MGAPDFPAEAIATAGGLAAWTRATGDPLAKLAARWRLASGAALERLQTEKWVPG